MKQRINVSVDERLLEKIDFLADFLGQSRSSFMSLAAATYIQQYEVSNALGMFKSLADEKQEVNQES